MNAQKEEIASITNPYELKGPLEEIIEEADIFIGVSQGNSFAPGLVQKMKEKPIILALANPDPEILPDLAYEAGAFIVCTGRSDFKNQVNNALAFPGLFRGLVETGWTTIDADFKLTVAQAIADYQEETKALNTHHVLPNLLERSLHAKIVQTIVQKVQKTHKINNLDLEEQIISKL